MPLDNDDIKQLIAILQKGLAPEENTKSVKSKRGIKTKTKTKQNNNINNVLGDDFSSLHREDIAIDKLLSKSKKNRPKTRRGAFKHIDVVCRKCGKKESISPSLLYESPDRYKCNKCCTSAG